LSGRVADEVRVRGLHWPGGLRGPVKDEERNENELFWMIPQLPEFSVQLQKLLYPE